MIFLWFEVDLFLKKLYPRLSCRRSICQTKCDFFFKRNPTRSDLSQLFRHLILEMTHYLWWTSENYGVVRNSFVTVLSRETFTVFAGECFSTELPILWHKGTWKPRSIFHRSCYFKAASLSNILWCVNLFAFRSSRRKFSSHFYNSFILREF